MTTPNPPTITQLETAAQTDITHALRDAYRAARNNPHTPHETLRTAELIAHALRQATAPTAHAITQHTHTAITTGATNARTEAPPPPNTTLNTTPTPQQTHNLTHDIPIHHDTRHILRDHATQLTTTRPTNLTPQNLTHHITTATNRLITIATTHIHRAHNRGRAWYARLFAYDMHWFTQPDERTCPTCRPLHGQIIGSQERFHAEVNWDAFDGQPPAHYRCRCYTEIIRRSFRQQQ